MNRLRYLLRANWPRTLLIGGGILLFVVVAVGLRTLSSSGIGGQQQKFDGDQNQKALNPNDKRPVGGVSQQQETPNDDRTDDLAFVADGRLSVINADGTDQIYLTDIPQFWGHNYDWSPEGEAITFLRDDGIYVINADDTGLRKLTDTYVNVNVQEPPDWSPDGEKIVFVSRFVSGGNKDLYIVNADGTGLRNLTGTGASEQESFPTFSPDSNKIAFVRNGDISVIRADGTGLRNLTSTGASEQVNSSPAFSPDGNKIAFIRAHSVRPDGVQVAYTNFDLYVMNADGTGQTRLASNVDALPYPYVTDIAFSPDSKKIAFSRLESFRAAIASEGNVDNPDIYVINADGTGLRKLTDTPTASEEAPAWSPDGEKIAFQRCCENASAIANASARAGTVSIIGIHVMNADGTGLRKLTDTPRPVPMHIKWRSGEQGIEAR